jgi:hypothetical protein
VFYFRGRVTQDNSYVTDITANAQRGTSVLSVSTLWPCPHSEETHWHPGTWHALHPRQAHQKRLYFFLNVSDIRPSAHLSVRGFHVFVCGDAAHLSKCIQVRSTAGVRIGTWYIVSMDPPSSNAWQRFYYMNSNLNIGCTDGSYCSDAFAYT